MVWEELLRSIILAKEQLDRLDHTQPATGPRVRATEDEVAAYERGSGERLPADYREFLLHANGWPHFFFRADLFGLPELGYLRAEVDKLGT